jgi:hypothetical protein
MMTDQSDEEIDVHALHLTLSWEGKLGGSTDAATATPTCRSALRASLRAA